MPTVTPPKSWTTTPSQFRLSPETIAALDRIAAKLTEDTGIPASRTDAVRFAARVADPKSTGKKSRK